MANRRRILLVSAAPIAFGVGFAQLGRLFEYPQILRQPSATVLARFHDQQAQILPWWWLMFVSALLFVPVSVAIAEWAGLNGTRLTVAKAAGLAGAIVQALGLSRWVFAVPILADRAADPDQARFALLLFDVLHNWLGVGLGEWAGYLFTAIWTALIAAAFISTHRWLAIVGIVIALGIGFGLSEVFGISAAGPVNALAYSLWVLWMLAVAFVLGRSQHDTHHRKQSA